MTDFKPGDRVRVTYEGEVCDTSSSSHLKIKTDHQFYMPYLNDPAVTIEKIAEPEPEWQMGDVVRRTEAAFPTMRVDGKWVCANGFTLSDTEISEAWSDGTLKILHRYNA